MIMVTLLRGGGLMKENLSKSLLCFRMLRNKWGECFSKCKTRVTKQIQDSWARVSMGVHYIAHRTNLIIQSLANLVFMAWIEMFMQNMY
jgi:hypothetical protein